ncbi:MAG: hypothetical protein GY849_19790, partial [Deltaproteobacteria bacterium]|nr:hypothetical protein [Deltaproteobacteria bacterium]
VYIGSVVTSHGSVVSGNRVGDTTVQVNVSTLSLGEVFVVRYTGEVSRTARPGTTVVSTTTMMWWSVPGTDGRLRERTASSLPLSVPVVSLSALSLDVVGTSVWTGLGTSQHNVGVTDVAVGEAVTFATTLTLLEGTTRTNLSMKLIPEIGLLELVSSRVKSVGSRVTPEYLSAGSSGTHSDELGGDGVLDTARWYFGDVVCHPDNVLSLSDVIVVEIDAIVRASSANVDGAVMTTQARAVVEGVTLETNMTVEVVEPRLSMSMAPNVTSGDAGDLVEYVVTVWHQDGSTASGHDLQVEDLFADAHRSLLVGTVSGTRALVVSGNSAGDVVVRVNVSAIEVGENVTVRWLAELQETLRPSTAITANATLSWWSVPGTVGRYRTARATAAPVSVPATPADGLTLSVADSTLWTGLGTSQHNVGVTDVAVGEAVTFATTLTLLEGTTRTNVTVRLPSTPGVLSVVSSRVKSVGGHLTLGMLSEGASGEHEDALLLDGVFDTVVFYFGDIVCHPDNVATSADRVTMEVVALVDSVSANADGVRS